MPDIHDLFPKEGPTLDDFAAEHGRSIGEPDWNFGPKDWPMVYDFLCDFGDTDDHLCYYTPQELRAMAQDYCHFTWPEPDPNFWDDLKKRYPAAFKD